MKYLRKAAARERRAPILWWFLMALAMGGMLCVVMWHHSKDGALFLGLILGTAWMAPLVAFLSLAAPRRATVPAPAPGEGSFSEWMKQTRLLGRVLLYYADNKELSKECHQSIQDARKDLRDTLKAHPLRDDLERICGRIRAGALKEVKAGFWRVNSSRIRELTREMEESMASGATEDEQLLMQQMVVEDAAALMARHCMPRMLERERLACAVDCAWLAAQAAPAHKGNLTPIELAARLVIEWSDFSEPWQPACMLRHALESVGVAPSIPAILPVASLQEEAPASPANETTEAPSAPCPALTSPEISPSKVSDGTVRPDSPHRRRVRVRVRRDRRYHRRRRGPSIFDILLSFGQWVRYSVRSWMLYR